MNENTEKKTIDYKEVAKKALLKGAKFGGAMLVCFVGLRATYKIGRIDGIQYVINCLKGYNPDESAKFIQYCVKNNL